VRRAAPHRPSGTRPMQCRSACTHTHTHTHECLL
jgi:hypothetical protein